MTNDKLMNLAFFNWMRRKICKDAQLCAPTNVLQSHDNCYKFEKIALKSILLFSFLFIPPLSAAPSYMLPTPIILKVRQSNGNCPKTVKVWNSFRLYEATGEHTVIAYTSEFANSPQITISSKKLVEYKAALKKEFASCYGSATYNGEDGINLYTFQFIDNNVYFRVILSPDTDANPSSFGTISIKDSRPFIKWAIAD